MSYLCSLPLEARTFVNASDVVVQQVAITRFCDVLVDVFLHLLCVVIVLRGSVGNDITVWIEISLSDSSRVTAVHIWRIQRSLLSKLEDDTSAVVGS